MTAFTATLLRAPVLLGAAHAKQVHFPITADSVHGELGLDQGFGAHVACQRLKLMLEAVQPSLASRGSSCGQHQEDAGGGQVERHRRSSAATGAAFHLGRDRASRARPKSARRSARPSVLDDVAAQNQELCRPRFRRRGSSTSQSEASCRVSGARQGGGGRGCCALHGEMMALSKSSLPEDLASFTFTSSPLRPMNKVTSAQTQALLLEDGLGQLVVVPSPAR